MRAIVVRIGLCAALFSSAACSSSPTEGADSGTRPTRVDINRNRSRWAAQRLSSYRYRLAYSCFCPVEARGPFQVTVVSGVVADATYVDTAEFGIPDGTPVPASDRSRVLTIEQLFARVQADLDRDPAELRAAFHPSLGYPAEVYVDYDRGIADDETGISAKGLVAP